MSFGLPVDPEVLTVIKESLANHSFKKTGSSFEKDSVYKISSSELEKTFPFNLKLVWKLFVFNTCWCYKVTENFFFPV